jgi:hypothetical protein
MVRVSDDVATLGAVGTLAAMTAALGHEALGHGGACLLTGGEITLLSVIWFRCAGGGAVTDLAGPLGGLLAGLAGMALAKWAPPRAVRARLFGLMLGAFALFWFSTQLLSDAGKQREDWVGVAAAAHWPEVWRVVAVLAGLLAYAAVLRLVWHLVNDIGAGAQARRRFLTPYAVGAVALVACAALRPRDGSAMETAQVFGLAPLGFVWAATRPSLASGSGANVARSWPWIAAAVSGLVIYAALFGRGVGRLA